MIQRELPSLPVEVSTTVKAVGGWEPESNDMRGIFLARGPGSSFSSNHFIKCKLDCFSISLITRLAFSDIS